MPDLETGADGTLGTEGKWTIRPIAYIGVLFCFGCDFSTNPAVVSSVTFGNRYPVVSFE
jgi:hypothetical protein